MKKIYSRLRAFYKSFSKINILLPFCLAVFSLAYLLNEQVINVLLIISLFSCFCGAANLLDCHGNFPGHSTFHSILRFLKVEDRYPNLCLNIATVSLTIGYIAFLSALPWVIVGAVDAF